MPLQVRAITAAEHRAYVAAQPSVPLEQTPGWGKGFVAARTESVGWFDGTRMIGAGLYRLRGLPRLPMRSVAVFESGPDIDWTGRRRPNLSLSDWLDPLAEHLRGRGVFTARVNPVIARHDWWGFDPSQRATGKAVVPHHAPVPLQDSRITSQRLESAGWRPMVATPPTFLAEVVLTRQERARRQNASAQSLLPSLSVREGTLDDLAVVHEAVNRAHSSLSLASIKEWEQRWRGLAGDNFAGVTLLVLERDGEVTYGGLFAAVGDRAWDLSAPLPLPDADHPAVRLLRDQVMTRSRAAGARTLSVPVINPQRRAPVKAPAPGWPPVHLQQLIGTWDYPVRATWHSVLAPVVDHLVL